MRTKKKASAKLFPAIIKFIPPSWQYPEITYVRLTLAGEEYLSENFHQSHWVVSQDIHVHGELAGKLEVFYIEERPELDEGPFVKEERNLINIIAERLGRVVESIEAERRRKEAEEKKEELIEKLQLALGEIKILRGILPICSYCKKIRDDKGSWNQVEVYVKRNTEADFSHSLCPECAQDNYPDIFGEGGIGD